MQDDLISRQAVLDMLENAQIITDGEFCGYCTEDIDINILPSVIPQPEPGHWIANVLDAGYKNGRVEFMIGGRKFMVKEMAQ